LAIAITKADVMTKAGIAVSC